MTVFSFGIGMISVSIVVFSIALILHDHENMQGPLLAFTQNVLEIFSIVFMAVGICLAIVDRKRKKTQTRGHNFETPPSTGSSKWLKIKRRLAGRQR